MHLARLSHYELELPRTTPTPTPKDGAGAVASRGAFETASLLGAQARSSTPTSSFATALRQRQLGAMELASFNFSTPRASSTSAVRSGGAGLPRHSSAEPPGTNRARSRLRRSPSAAPDIAE